jgi:hypothetical protein
MIMPRRYAYSYNREDYTGSFPNPEEALLEAVRNSEGLSSPPTEIYVGAISQADPQASDHAESIVNAMSRRAFIDYGDSAANYLRNLTPEQSADLELSIEQTLLGWLRKHNLMPTFVKFEGIREYPVTRPGGMPMSGPANGETREIGAAVGVE